MRYFLSFLLAGTASLAGLTGAGMPLTPVRAAEPIKALLVTGGCCHDYEKQKLILSEGISGRANVAWTIVHEGGTDRNARIGLYLQPDWYKGYDVVVHNECFGSVKDVAYVERITRPHYDGLPAVVIHCAMHSYREAKTDEWRKLLGVSSFSHEGHRPVEVKNLAADHPIMQGFPGSWKTPNGELYKIEKAWEHMTTLARAYGQDTKKDHACIWTNEYGKARVFGTTLGHHNETMESPEYLDVVSRGLLWACGKLDEKGQPAEGYGPGE